MLSQYLLIYSEAIRTTIKEIKAKTQNQLFYDPTLTHKGGSGGKTDSGKCTVLRTGQPVATQDVFFWRLAGRSAPTGLAIVHWIGCINAIKSAIL